MNLDEIKVLGEEIFLPSLFLDKSSKDGFRKFSERDNEYFFWLEHLIKVEAEVGNYDRNGIKLRNFCLNGIGQYFYDQDFLRKLRGIDEETWIEVYRDVEARKLDVDRQTPIGMNLEDVAENLAYLKEVRNKLKRPGDDYLRPN